MNIRDEIMPEVKSEVRLYENTLIIKIDDIKKIDRIILEDDTIFCKSFYHYIEDEKI